MGNIHSIIGTIHISNNSLNELLECELDDKIIVKDLFSTWGGNYSYDLDLQILNININTKFNYLFESFYKALAYYKDIQSIDEILTSNEYNNWIKDSEVVQIKQGAFRYFDKLRNKITYNLTKKDGWVIIYCLTNELTLNLSNDTIDIIGKKGERFIVKRSLIDLEIYAFNAAEDFNNFILKEAGSIVEWRDYFAKNVSFDINNWIELQNTVENKTYT